tara:strand:- start:41 stop:403 length:363 start_codon:yes stop_codon:yes gene_type:complete
VQKILLILVVAFLVGCVSAQLRERMQSTDQQMDRIERLMSDTDDAETLDSLESELGRLLAARSEQEAQATEERLDSVGKFTSVAGSLIHSAAPLLTMIGIPGVAGIAGWLGRILRGARSA